MNIGSIGPISVLTDDFAERLKPIGSIIDDSVSFADLYSNKVAVWNGLLNNLKPPLLQKEKTALSTMFKTLGRRDFKVSDIRRITPNVLSRQIRRFGPVRSSFITNVFAKK